MHVCEIHEYSKYIESVIAILHAFKSRLQISYIVMKYEWYLNGLDTTKRTICAITYNHIYYKKVLLVSIPI